MSTEHAHHAGGQVARPPSATPNRPLGGRLERCRPCKDVYTTMFELKNEGLFSDVSVHMPDGREVRAHKIILGTASQALRSHLLQFPDAPAINLADFLAFDPQNVAELVLDYCYSRVASVHPGNVIGVARAARDLGVYDLHQLATSMQARFVAADPAGMIPAAVQLNMPDLVKQICAALVAPEQQRGIVDAASWDAVAHLARADFTALVTAAAAVLTMDRRFDLVQSYISKNVAPASHRVCIVHPEGRVSADHATAAASGTTRAREASADSATDVVDGGDSAAPIMLDDDDESDDDSDWCTCAQNAPLSPEDTRAFWGLIDFSALETETLARGFGMAHVPHDLVFGAVMQKLVSVQQQQSMAAQQHPPAVARPGTPSTAAMAAAAPAPTAALADMSHAEQMAFVATTLSRMKVQEQQQQQHQQQHQQQQPQHAPVDPSSVGSPLPPLPQERDISMSHVLADAQHPTSPTAAMHQPGVHDRPGSISTAGGEYHAGSMASISTSYTAHTAPATPVHAAAPSPLGGIATAPAPAAMAAGPRPVAQQQHQQQYPPRTAISGVATSPALPVTGHPSRTPPPVATTTTAAAPAPNGALTADAQYAAYHQAQQAQQAYLQQQYQQQMYLQQQQQAGSSNGAAVPVTAPPRSAQPQVQQPRSGSSSTVGSKAGKGNVVSRLSTFFS
ncbi:hypothetical protein BC828DRAFT_405123 [Blastocladiella britannica]|nr:hypothetical protein BC828DRAFT_405123 [Blastocladiella britannica]